MYWPKAYRLKPNRVNKIYWHYFQSESYGEICFYSNFMKNFQFFNLVKNRFRKNYSISLKEQTFHFKLCLVQNTPYTIKSATYIGREEGHLGERVGRSAFRQGYRSVWPFHLKLRNRSPLITKRDDY